MVRSLIKGSLRYQDGDGHEKVTQKVNLRSFNLYRDYFNSFTLSNANHIRVQEEKENLVVACLRPP